MQHDTLRRSLVAAMLIGGLACSSSGSDITEGSGGSSAKGALPAAAATALRAATAVRAGRQDRVAASEPAATPQAPAVRRVGLAVASAPAA